MNFKAHDVVVVQKVEYDWFPTLCTLCGKWDHLTKDCDPDKRNRVWKPKQKLVEKLIVEAIRPLDDCFKKVY